jgi:hypothetical protein
MKANMMYVVSIAGEGVVAWKFITSASGELFPKRPDDEDAVVPTI